MPDAISRLNAALKGRYHVERELGEGGMATVYLTVDLRHHRKVALKVLRPELAAIVGSERFLAEIRTTAALQHPHILPLHDSGEAGGLLFYVMPRVEGESLRDRLDREHQLPIDEAVRIASAVAQALDYAHRHGVIHRDIKPANILIHDGQPVISDFGIALAVTTGGAGRMTETGLSLGTPHYMSPEQSTGDSTVGPATDLWALGCVLHEMLTGEPPFTGTTPQAVLGKIITADARSVREARRSVPSNVDAAIAKALEKLPADRFGSASEFAEALADPAFRYGVTAAATTALAARPWRGVALAGWGVAAMLAIVAAAVMLRPEPRRSVTRFELTLPEDLVRFAGLDISPDGSAIVFGAFSATDSIWALHLRRGDQLDASPIPGTEGGGAVRFSPDAASVAFIVSTSSGGSLRVVSLDGTPPVTLVRDSVFEVEGLGWGTDGMIYFGKLAEDGLWRVPEGGGEIQRVTDGPADRHPQLLPDGAGLLLTRAQTVSVLDFATGEMTPLFAGVVARYAPSGHLVYAARDAARTLLAVPFDADAIEVMGSPRTIAAGLGTDANNLSDIGLSEDGTLVYRLGRGGPGEGELVWLSRDGTAESVHPELAGVIEAPALSPDGQRIAFDRADGERRDVWVHDLRTGSTQRLTFDGAINRRPEWSTDGTHVGFVGDRDGPQAFYSVALDEGGSPSLLRSPAESSVLWEALWTPDERWLLYRQLPRSGVGHILYAAPHPDSVPHPFVTTEFFNAHLSLSPNGEWLTYQSDESGRSEIYARAFPGPGRATMISVNGGTTPIWSRDGRKIFYVAGDNWMTAAVRTAPTFQVESREVFASTEGYTLDGLIQRYDVSPAGERILAIRDLSNAPTRYIVVQNFVEELQRQMRE